MAILHLIIPVFWVIFLIYWAVSALRAKQSVGGTVWWRHAALRLSILVLVVLAWLIPDVHRILGRALAHESDDVLTGVIGAVVVALGLGLAIYARIYLGRNWGMPMSRNQNPELVTGGPYAFIRHPIYSGVILAMLGSAIGLGLVWVPPLVGFGAYFIYSARREEEFMIQQFGEIYRAYMRQTKMLVPYVL
jgi:protein-S-isoprenylcysteine O-methyltransferase Ste14